MKNQVAIYNQLRDCLKLFQGTWESPFAYFKFVDDKKTDPSGKLCIRVNVYSKKDNTSETHFYDVDTILNYLVLKSKITRAH